MKIRVNWKKVVWGLKLFATVVGTVVGTLAVQSCS
jgi:uncharacterized membrane-anchored protein YhcB (DUF1043 family)